MTGAADNGATLLDSKKKLISKTYLRNAWYVAAWSDDLVDGQLLARTIMKEPVVLYRKADGREHFDRVVVAYVDGGYVCERAGVQASNVLSGMAAATGLAVLEDGPGIEAGLLLRADCLEPPDTRRIVLFEMVAMKPPEVML